MADQAGMVSNAASSTQRGDGAERWRAHTPPDAGQIGVAQPRRRPQERRDERRRPRQTPPDVRLAKAPAGTPAPTSAPWQRKKSAASSRPIPPTQVTRLWRLPIEQHRQPQPEIDHQVEDRERDGGLGDGDLEQGAHVRCPSSRVRRRRAASSSPVPVRHQRAAPARPR